MKLRRSVSIWMMLVLAAFGAAHIATAQETGTLVFDLKNFTPDAKMPKYQQKAWQQAGIRWAMLDNSVVISLVSEKHVAADLPYQTRFGEQKKLELKPGNYSITCIGFIVNTKTEDEDELLSKSAFFNEDIVSFEVLPGKTTTLQITTMFDKKSPRYLWVRIFMPDLKVQVVVDGKSTGEEVVITDRTAKSVAWDDYRGPLKFSLSH